MYNIPGWGYETSYILGGGYFCLRSFLFITSSLSAVFCSFLRFPLKVSEFAWLYWSVVLTLVIENPLNARSLLSKAKLPNLVLCALLGKCRGAFIVLFTCFYHAFTSGTILIISPLFPL